MFPIRHIAALFLALLTAAAAAPAGGQQLDVTCTNPHSGSTWQISIDLARQTVDGYPARIGDDQIVWHDAKDGGNYTLDRHSGELSVIVASSTGGYFLHDHCRFPP